MDRIWPANDAPDSGMVADHDLEQFYAYPSDLRKPWFRGSFVSSLDGSATVHGSSRGLSSPADLRVLKLIRDLSDVVLVGAGTALRESYRGLKPTETRLDRRRRHGLSEVPPIAVVTRRCSLPPDSPLFTHTEVPPIVLTCAAAPTEQRAEFADAGADVVVAGVDDVDPHAVLRALDDRGLFRIGCEGGPALFGTLLEADLVDELCLTMSPLLAGGDSGRITTGARIEQARPMRLVGTLLAERSVLLLRYQRERRPSSGAG